MSSVSCYSQDMFPCLSIEQVRHLLNEASGNMDDAVEMIFELLNDTPSTSNLSPVEESISGGYELVDTLNHFTITSLLSPPSEPNQNEAISESYSNRRHSITMERK